MPRRWSGFVAGVRHITFMEIAMYAVVRTYSGAGVSRLFDAPTVAEGAVLLQIE